MRALTTKDHWSGRLPRERIATTMLPKRLVRALLGRERLDRLTKSYSEELFWETVTRFIPRSPRVRSLEIGSAPGHFSVELHRRLGCEPFGLEYTEAGAEVNRAVFAQAGISPENVIEADFFDERLLKQQRGQFDVVMSRGFIEHFDEPKRVIERHAEFVKNGGFLIITIPRLRGLGYLITRLICPELLPKHNLKIMSRRSFAELFAGQDIRPLYLGLLPGVGVHMFTSASARSGVRLLGASIQRAIDLLLRVFPFQIRSELVSPQLVFLGVKSRKQNSERVRPVDLPVP